jgi:hypothetical protein
MAITFDTATGFSGNTTGGVANQTVTFTGFTAASGAMIVVGAAVRHPSIMATITGITYNSIAIVADRFHVFSFGAGQNFYSDPALTPIGDGSPHNLVVTTDTANCDVVLSISSWLGVGSVNDSLTGGNATGTGTTASTTVSTSAAGEVIVDHVVLANSSTTATPNVSQTLLADTAITSSIRDAGSWKPGAASVALSWSLGASVTWIVQAMALIPAGVSGQPAARRIAEDTPGLAPGSVRRM